MAEPTKTQMAKAIEDELVPLRAKLDQLVKKADDEGFNVERATTEALMGVLGELHSLEEDARKHDLKRTLHLILKERSRCRQGLGLEPRRKRGRR